MHDNKPSVVKELSPKRLSLFLFTQLYCAVCAVMKYIFVLPEILVNCEQVPALITGYLVFLGTHFTALLAISGLSLSSTY